nr:acyltransferase family protein [uncultured Anaerobutyricum sp.]
MQKKRIEYLDVARGIAMLSVVLGHMGIFNINRVVFTYHLPIFFFITGYFFSKKSTTIEFIKKKFRTLIIPYYVTGVLILLCIILRDCLVGGNLLIDLRQMIYAILYASGNQYDKPFYIASIGALWFLWGTFWGSLFLKLITRIHSSLSKCISVVIIYIICVYLKQKFCWFPLSIQAGGCALLFIYLGCIFKENQYLWEKTKKPIKYIIIIVLVLQWIWFMKNFNGFWIVACNIGHGIPDIIGSIGGCIVLLIISRIINKNRNWLLKILSFTGKNSIIFLAVHGIELRVVNWKMVIQYIGTFFGYGKYNGTGPILIVFFKLAVIYMGMLLILKIKFLKNLYTGKVKKGIS